MGSLDSATFSCKSRALGDCSITQLFQAVIQRMDTTPCSPRAPSTDKPGDKTAVQRNYRGQQMRQGEEKLQSSAELQQGGEHMMGSSDGRSCSLCSPGEPSFLCPRSFSPSPKGLCISAFISLMQCLAGAQVGPCLQSLCRCCCLPGFTCHEHRNLEWQCGVRGELGMEV